jgi:hypothetical protein
MRNPISKAIVAVTAALTMSAAVISSTAPASAGMRMGGGFGGGFHGSGVGGGFHGSGVGGAFHPGVGGGFHPGFRPGFNRSFVFVNRGRFFRRGFFGPAFVGGVAVGSAWGWGWDSGCWTYRPFYDAAGRYLGDGYVNICS